MNAHEQVKEVRDIVRHYFEENSMYTGIDNMSEDNKEHVIAIGASILCTKWGIGYEGGSFVQAVVENDLQGAIGRADGISLRALKFFCQLMYNTSQPSIFNADIDEDHDLDQVMNSMAKDLGNE